MKTCKTVEKYISSLTVSLSRLLEREKLWSEVISWSLSIRLSSLEASRTTVNLQTARNLNLSLNCNIAGEHNIYRISIAVAGRRRGTEYQG